MPPPRVKSKPRSRNKNGRWRRKRSDTGRPRTRHEEGEVKGPLQVSDEKQEDGKDSFSEQVVAKIQEGLREHKIRKFAQEHGGHGVSELPAKIKEFYTLMDEGDREHWFYSIDCSVCAECNVFDYQTGKMIDLHPEIPIQWVCVGLIPYKNDPRDDHEELNRIRVCLNTDEDIICHEMTLWEAHRLGEILIQASGVFLLKDQPGGMWAKIEELLVVKEGEENETKVGK